MTSSSELAFLKNFYSSLVSSPSKSRIFYSPDSVSTVYEEDSNRTSEGKNILIYLQDRFPTLTKILISGYSSQCILNRTNISVIGQLVTENKQVRFTHWICLNKEYVEGEMFNILDEEILYEEEKKKKKIRIRGDKKLSEMVEIVEKYASIESIEVEEEDVMMEVDAMSSGMVEEGRRNKMEIDLE